MPLDQAKLWTELPIATIDFETTSADPLTCAPVEVAAVRFEGGRAVDQWSSLINPGCPIPEAATAIHGITDAMVADAPTLELVAPELFRLAKDAVPCAYNAPFDRTVLHRYITGADCPAFDPAQLWIDAYVVIASVDKFVPGAGRLKLAAACKRWGVLLDNAHRAMADAVVTGQLLFRLLEQQQIKPCPLGKLLAHTDKRRAEMDVEFAQWRKQVRERERLVWRQYVCAAIKGRDLVDACRTADVLLEAENDRFEKGGA